MSANSDEIAEGILKAVFTLAMPFVFGYVVYFIVTHPLLLLGLAALAGVAAVMWLGWLTLNALKAHTATLGTLVAWGVLSGLLCGGFAYFLTDYWWWGWAVLGGTAGTIITALLKTPKREEEPKRHGLDSQDAEAVMRELEQLLGHPKPK